MMEIQSLYEVKPPRFIIERAISLLSLKSTTPQKGTGCGGAPDITPADAAAACAGYSDPIGGLLLGALCGNQRDVNRLVSELDKKGWALWRERSVSGWITVQAHRKLSYAAVVEFLGNTKVSDDEISELLGIRKEKKTHFLKHLDELRGILLDRQSKLSEHLFLRMKDF